jgi:hypothetical protein
MSRCDVAYWHFDHMTTVSENVRSSGEETEVAGLSRRPSGCAADPISCAASAGPYSYSDTLGHIDVLHAQQLNKRSSFIAGGDHE